MQNNDFISKRKISNEIQLKHPAPAPAPKPRARAMAAATIKTSVNYSPIINSNLEKAEINAIDAISKINCQMDEYRENDNRNSIDGNNSYQKITNKDNDHNSNKIYGNKNHLIKGVDSDNNFTNNLLNDLSVKSKYHPDNKLFQHEHKQKQPSSNELDTTRKPNETIFTNSNEQFFTNDNNNESNNISRFPLAIQAKSNVQLGKQLPFGPKVGSNVRNLISRFSGKQ